jgi:ABC-2 type transport system permease protein
MSMLEQAPSDTRTETPTVTRYLIGFGGLFLVTLGVASVIAFGYGRGIFGDLGAEAGYLCTAAGTALLLFHAFRDSDLEIRRAYGVLGAGLLLVAVGVGVFPAKPENSDVAVAGHLLLPWGGLTGLVALLFLVAFARHETEDPYRTWVRIALLGTGGLLVAACVVCGVAVPDLMAGPGAVLGVIGVAYLCGYFAVSDSSEELPYWAGVGLAAAGGFAVLFALFRTVAPDVLYAGPAVLRKPDQSLNGWAVFGRALLILLGLSGLLALWARRWPLLVRGAVAAAGIAFATLFVVASFYKGIHEPPAPYLVPGGLLLAGLGAMFLAVGVAVTVDAPVVVLLRRELAAFFYSPIAYVVLFGNALIAGVSYLFFIGTLFNGDPEFDRGPVPEPIVGRFWALTMGAAFSVPVLVAAITMRTFSEEKRTGTLEVLLTSPVNDWAVVLSKFLAALAFFMLCWLPAAGYLVALRFAGGTPFDYRPLLSYYLAMLACGVSFVGFGVFVSSLTKNQIVAAVITFAGVFAMLLTALRDAFPADVLSRGLKDALGKLDYFSLWNQALNGQLPVSEVCVQVSLGVFWLFLTVKVLEARRWA